MLIEANRMLSELAKRKQELMSATFDTPPSDYATFKQVVGRVCEISETEKLVRELARQGDD